VGEPTVVAIDWSGARGEGPLPNLWVTARRDREVIADSGSWSRAAAVDFVLTQRPPVVAGFDFSFGLPAWFARELGCRTIVDVWAWARREGETWLAPTAPFWRTRCEVAPAERFRACEERLRAHRFRPKSVFQLVGNGQVGAGSVRGMPHLARLRASGFAIWPFDAAGPRVAVEIYPTLLRRRFPEFEDRNAPSADARDARVSVRVMQARTDEITTLRATRDAIERIEGDVWVPATWP
jgi:hypothetical protein